MEYLTTKETAQKWGVNVSLVRRYCTQERIPGVIQRDVAWLIPEEAKRPMKIEQGLKEPVVLPALAQKLLRQKKEKSYHGLYDYVQINLTYNSCRMASNRLTRQQVETIFKKGKMSVSFEPMKVSDLVEVLNYCVCVDYILDHAQEPLTPKFIKDLHYQMVFGTVDDRRKRVAPGQYRSPKSSRRVPFMLPADQISSKLKALIVEYEALTEVERRDILCFHVGFERIFPFEDCNGRIGRLILFKECLRHDMMPVIIDDKRRNRYLEGLREWDDDPGILTEVVMEAQSCFNAQIQMQNLSQFPVVRRYGGLIMMMDYTLAGDYYIPNLELPQESRPMGKWGRMHRRYLETHHPIRYNQLILSGTLWTYLADLNEQAQAPDRTNENRRGRYCEVEGCRSDGVGAEDEQYPSQSRRSCPG